MDSEQEPPAAGSARNSGNFVQSFERGLDVIKAFGDQHKKLTLSQVAAKTGLTRSSARRFLLTLEELGYVGVEGTNYFLKPAVLQLGYAYLSSLSLSDIAPIYLNSAAEELHESCSASVLDGQDIVYIARASTTRIMSFTLSVGHRLPAVWTSMGRVLLAALPEEELEVILSREELSPRTDLALKSRDELREEIRRVREQGYSIVDQELEIGVRSVAVPVRDSRGKVIASVNASAHSTRVDAETMVAVFLPRIVEVASSIERDLARIL
jgi:IclR family pca regulon transcriptional regulator